MKRLLTTFALFFFAAAFSACGSATEVGNPTGDLPRTMTGIIDQSTLPDLSTSAAKVNDAVEPALNVYAQAASGVDVEAPVDANWTFTMEVIVGRTYAFSVRSGTEKIGDFSFEQDHRGQRGPSLNISAPGDDVDLGICRFEEGVFKPEIEPRRYQGVGGGGGFGNDS